MNVRRDLHAACARAKIPPCSPNDLRRTYASWLKQAVVDSAVVAKLLGHSSTKMVDLVYGRIDDATLARAASLLPGGDCEAGVQDSSAHQGQMGRIGKRQTGENLVSGVLGVGIEPTTRGFSVRFHVNKFNDIRKKRGSRTAGVPRIRETDDGSPPVQQ